MDQVVGYQEFKQKMRMYLVNLAKDIRDGKKTEQTIYVLLGPPGIGGRSDTGILEGVSPSIKAAYPGRLCSGIAISKDRGAVVLLDEFEKFLGYRVDLSDCVLLCTANYADQVPDFVQSRAEMVNIELASYGQRVEYVMKALRKKLRGDEDTKHYAEQLDEGFWYRQTNANMETTFKTLRGYGSEEINQAINDFTDYMRVRNENELGDSVVSLAGLEWPEFGFSKPKKISVILFNDLNETEFAEYDCRIIKNENNEIEIVTRNYFGSIVALEQQEQAILRKIRKKIGEEYRHPSIELETEQIEPYRRGLENGFKLSREELEEWKGIIVKKGKLSGAEAVSYDLGRPDLGILWRKQLYFVSSF
ncbi:4822_t:CDS:2, partial [Scutellospora calospora]